MNGTGRGERSTFSHCEMPFSCFKDLTPSEYYGFVTEGINFNHINDLHRLLESVPLPEGIVIATCGSDGKLEQHPQSQTELVVIEERADMDGDNLVRNFFGAERYRELFDVGDEGAIDTKAFDTEGPFSYAYDDSDIVYPDRVLNTVPIYPLTDSALNLYYRARERALTEMAGSKHIKKEMRDQLRDYKRAMQTGIYRKVRAFDAEKHMQYYSEKPSQYTLGFKTSFLRAVQRKLDLLTLQLHPSMTWADVARTMPPTTVGRLAYLAEAGVITADAASSTGEAYAWSLQQYHHVQDEYKANGSPTEIPFDPDAFARYSEAIERFAARQ